MEERKLTFLDWTVRAKEMFEEVKAFSDILRFDYAGYNGFLSWTQSFKTPDGIVLLDFFFNQQDELIAKATLVQDAVSKPLGSIKVFPEDTTP